MFWLYNVHVPTTQRLQKINKIQDISKTEDKSFQVRIAFFYKTVIKFMLNNNTILS